MIVTPQLQSNVAALEALLVSRIYMYTVFHKLFGGVPTAELLTSLLGATTKEVVDEYAEDSASMCGLEMFLAQARTQDFEQLLDSAKDEYTRTFIGPASLPSFPVESPYLTHDLALFQENTLVVRAIYQQRGLQPKRYPHVPDDHVSLLCAYAAKLGTEALEEFRDGNWQGVVICLREQEAFISQHLAHWVPEFAEILRRKSKTTVLYPQMVEALAVFSVVDVSFCIESAYWLEDQQETLFNTTTFETAAGVKDAEADLLSLAALRLFGLEDCELELLTDREARISAA